MTDQKKNETEEDGTVVAVPLLLALLPFFIMWFIVTLVKSGMSIRETEFPVKKVF